MTGELLVRGRGLTKHYRVTARGARRRLVAVNDVDLDVAQGEIRALVGESGCGKSTTGRLLLGLEPLSAGEVTIDGRDVASLSAKQLRALRRDVQTVSQDPYDALNPRMTVRTILREPARVHGLERGEHRSVEELLELVNLSADFADRHPHELSGGQRQRIAIARAVALDPRFIVCDEPVSALDVSVQAQIVNLLRRLQSELGLAYLFISHDLALVRYLAHSTSVMYLARVVEEGPTETLFAAPRHPYTQLLLAAVPRTRRDHDARPVRRLGELPSPLDAPSGCVFASRCPLVDDRCRAERPELRPIGEHGHRVACHYAETADVAR